MTVLLLAGFVAVGGFVWASQQHAHNALPPALTGFADQYGRTHNSQYGEEWLIRDFFRDRRGGVFVDVGANHHQHYNNTYFLETGLGWSGIAIEPQTQFAAGYAQHRPGTRFRAFFVSDVSDQQAQLYVLKQNSLVASADKRFTERWGQNAKAIATPTITLNDLLTSERVTQFDFLNMDIETWEPKALAGFDINRFQPSLVCIEAHPEVTQEILEYFARHQYVLVAKYLRADEHNLYFTPVQVSADLRAAGHLLMDAADHQH